VGQSGLELDMAFLGEFLRGNIREYVMPEKNENGLFKLLVAKLQENEDYQTSSNMMSLKKTVVWLPE